MSEFKFVQDGNILSYSTPDVEVEEQIVVKVRKALWKSLGVRLTVEELTALGVQLKYIPTQTKERLDYEHISTLYQYVPVFASRVAEWKAMYDELGVAYDARTEDIEAAELTKFAGDDVARGDFHDRFMGKRIDVMVNYQAAERAYSGVVSEEYDPIDDFYTWTDLPTLIKWLPGTYDESIIPVHKEEEIVVSSSREAELVADMNAEDTFSEESTTEETASTETTDTTNTPAE